MKRFTPEQENSEVTSDTVMVKEYMPFFAPKPSETVSVGNRPTRMSVMRLTQKTTEITTEKDTLTTDSVDVKLPIERKTYRDSMYMAIVSGYDPRLEYIEVYPTTNYIYRTITKKEYSKRKPFSLGVGVGYGFNGKEYAPYIGIGIHYKIFEW